MEKVLVHNRDLCCPKFALEGNQTQKVDLQVKKVLETSTSLKLRNWRFLFVDFILYDILRDDPKEAAAIKRKAPRLYYNAITRILYHRPFDGILLRYLIQKEAQETLRKAHGICRATNQDPSLDTDFDDLAIICRR